MKNICNICDSKNNYLNVLKDYHHLIYKNIVSNKIHILRNSLRSKNLRK